MVILSDRSDDASSSSLPNWDCFATRKDAPLLVASPKRQECWRQSETYFPSTEDDRSRYDTEYDTGFGTGNSGGRSNVGAFRIEWRPGTDAKKSSCPHGQLSLRHPPAGNQPTPGSGSFIAMIQTVFVSSIYSRSNLQKACDIQDRLPFAEYRKFSWGNLGSPRWGLTRNRKHHSFGTKSLVEEFGPFMKRYCNSSEDEWASH